MVVEVAVDVAAGVTAGETVDVGVGVGSGGLPQATSNAAMATQAAPIVAMRRIALTMTSIIAEAETRFRIRSRSLLVVGSSPRARRAVYPEIMTSRVVWLTSGALAQAYSPKWTPPMTCRCPWLWLCIPSRPKLDKTLKPLGASHHPMSTATSPSLPIRPLPHISLCSMCCLGITRSISGTQVNLLTMTIISLSRLAHPGRRPAGDDFAKYAVAWRVQRHSLGGLAV